MTAVASSSAALKGRSPIVSIALYYTRLLASSLLLFVIVITLLFFLLELAPGDPVQSFVGDQPISEEFRAYITASFGLDKSVWERYLIYIGKVFTGDLGTTFATNQRVGDLIMGRLANTLALTVPSFILASIGGVVLGAIAARSRKVWVDGGISASSVAFFSIPNFWFGLMLITFFGLYLGWLPTQGTGPFDQSGISWEYAILPVITLATTEIAFKARIMRASTIEALGLDFNDTARSKGLSSQRILWRHALPNAMLPMVTVMGLSLSYILAGSVLVERVFGWPGIGLLFVEGIAAKNNQVVLGVTIVLTITVLVVNALTDIVYGIVDPRLRARYSRMVRGQA